MPALPLVLVLVPVLLLPWLRRPWWWRRVLPCVAALLLLVLLGLATWVHPALDDWIAASLLRQVGWWQGQVIAYRTLGGRVTASCVVFTANAGGTIGYRLAVVLLLALQLVALRQVVRSCWPSVPARQTWAIAVVVMGGVAVLLPSPAQAYFWLPGASCYLLGVDLGLVAIALLARRTPASPVAALAVGALAGGCSEMAGVLLGVTAGVGALTASPTPEDRRRRRACLACLIGVLVGLAMVAAAPGNAHRLQALGTPPLSHVRAGLTAVTLPASLAVTLLTGPASLGLLLLGLAWGCRHPRPWPRLQVLLLAGGLGIALAALPALALVGSVPPREADGLVAVAMLVALAVAVRIGMALRSWRPPAPAAAQLAAVALGCSLASLGLLLDVHGDSGVRLTGGVGAVVGLLVAHRLWRQGDRRVRLERWRLLGAGAVLLIAGILTSGTASRAAVDLVVHAPRRSRELAAREAALVAAAPRLRAHGGVVRVPLADPRHFPATISVGDLTSAPGAWVNRAYAAAHGLPAIAVDPRVQALPSP